MSERAVKHTRTLDVLWAIRDARGLSATERVCLLMLLAFADGKPRDRSGKPKDPFLVRVTHERLAEATELTDRTVRTTLATLKSRGLVTVTIGGQHRPNSYAIRPETISTLKASPRPEPVSDLNGSRPETISGLPKSRPEIDDTQTGNWRHPDRKQFPPLEDLSEDLERGSSFSLVPSEGIPTSKKTKHKPHRKAAPKEGSSDHQTVIAHWFKCHEAAKGVKPLKVEGKNGIAAKEMLQKMSLASALDVITKAYADPGFVTFNPSLAMVWNLVEKYRGTPTIVKGTPRPLQPASSSWTPAAEAGGLP